MNQTRLIQPEDLSTQEIFSMENLTNACRQVRRNNGAAGVDGVKARELPVCPGEYWEQLREQILDRSYKPLPAKRTDIPKPDGSMRGLNVPAARDRVRFLTRYRPSRSSCMVRFLISSKRSPPVCSVSAARKKAPCVSP